MAEPVTEKTGEKEQNEHDEESQTEYKRCMIGGVPFTFNVTFAKSKLGICNAAEIILSLLALLIMRGSYPYYCIGYHGIYQFYDWVSGSVFFSRLILYILFTVSIEDQHCPQIVPWLHLRVIILGIFTVFYFAASIAMAAGVCGFGVFITAMVLGFIITPVLGADLWFSIQEMRNRPHPLPTRHTWEERRTFTTWEERSTVQVAVF